MINRQSHISNKQGLLTIFRTIPFILPIAPILRCDAPFIRIMAVLIERCDQADDLRAISCPFFAVVE